MKRFITLQGVEQLILQAARDGLFTEVSIALRMGDEERHFSYHVRGVNSAKILSLGDTCTRRRLFDIASVTKLLLTLLMFRLIKVAPQQHKLSRESVVRDYVEFSGQHADKLQLKHLLNCHSELNPFMTSGQVTDIASLKEMCQQIKTVGLVREPGQHFRYANWQSIILGEILEKTFNAPLHVLMRTWILNPLGMKNTHPAFTLGEKKRECMKSGADFDVGVLSDPVARVADKGGILLGSAGLFSTTEDLLKVVDLILQMGRHLTHPNMSVDKSTLPYCSFIDSSDIQSLLVPSTPTGKFAMGMGLWKNFMSDVLQNAAPEEFHPMHFICNMNGSFKRGYGGCVLAVFPQESVGVVIGTDFLSVSRSKAEEERARILLNRFYARIAAEALTYRDYKKSMGLIDG